MENVLPLPTWRERLQPWRDALQFKLQLSTPPLPTREEICDVWLALNYFATENFHAESWLQMLQALELFDLLVQVDGPTGWTLLLEIVDVDRVFRINETMLFDPNAVRPQYELILEVQDMLVHLSQAFEACGSMADINYRPVHEREFLEVQQLLLTTWSEKNGGQPFNRGIQGRIYVQPNLRVENTATLQFVAQAMNELTTKIQQSRVRWSSMDSSQKRLVTNPFVVPAIGAVFVSDDQLCPEIVETLKSVVHRQIPIKNLVLRPALLDENSANAFFNKLLCPMTIGHTGVQRLELTSRVLSDSVVEALCTALVHSHGLKEFVLGASSDYGFHRIADWHWAWLVYSLFQSGNAHDISSVSLQVDGLNSSHVAAIRNVLESSEPPPFLVSSRTDIERPTSGSSVAHLELNYVEQSSRHAVLGLLELVGASLDRLALRNYSIDSFSDEFMKAAAAHCPNLKRLEITDAGVTLDWLCSNAHTHPITTESLVIEGRMNNPSIMEFFHALGTTNHKLTKTLKHLHWSVWGSSTPPLEAMDAWLGMLDKNRILEQSEIIMSDKGMSAYQLAKYEERFDAHNGQFLLDMRRLAFLSVLSPPHSSFQLTPETIQHVMDFAWYPKQRICGAGGQRTRQPSF